MLDIAVVNTALPTLQVDLDTDLHALKWVLDAYTLALASVVLTAGSLADRYGRRRLFAIGVTVFTRQFGGRGGVGHDRVADRRAGGPGARRGADVRRLAGAAEQRVPHARGAHEGVRGLRRDDRRVVRARARSRAACSPRGSAGSGCS